MNKQYARLADLAELITKGTTPTTLGFDFTDEGIGFLRVQNIEGGRVLFDQETLHIDEETHHVLKRSQIKPGDVLVSIAGSIGRSAVVPENAPELNCNQAVAIVRTNNDVLQPYLRLWLESSDAQSQMRGATVTGTISNLSLTQLGNLKLPLPPIAEQKRIAAILNKAEELRSLRRQALGALDALTQSIFLEMFGDAAKNDRNWQTERMEDLIQIRRGASPRPIDKYLGGDINWIKIGDGTKGSDIYLESCSDKVTSEGARKSVFLKAGSLIFANCGVSLGFARILKVDGCIHDGWLSFENIPEKKLNKLFLLKALNSITEHFRDIAPAGTQPNLNTGLMKNFRVILPPLSLQQEFARRLEAIEQLKATHRQSLAHLDALFASLQHRAFRGEL